MSSFYINVYTNLINEEWKHRIYLGRNNSVLLFSLPDAPEGGEAAGDAAAVQEELDIFGPMVSNPLPSSSNTQQAQVHTHTHILCEDSL